MTKQDFPFLDQTFDELANLLGSESPYLIHPHDRRGVRHFPTPELFELLIWNVIVAFFVNIFASAAFEWARKFFRRSSSKAEQEELVSRDELFLFKEEIKNSIESLSPGKKKTLKNLIKTSKFNSDKILQSYGLPEKRATVLSKEIDKILKNCINILLDKDDGKREKHGS